MQDDASPLFSGLLQPTNLQAERALLGALLANNKAYHRVAGIVGQQHFAEAANGRIFAAIARRVDSGAVADAVTLRDEFENAGILDELGGVPYLTHLITSMVGIINAPDYAQVVRDCWIRRELIEAGEVLVNQAYGHGEQIAPMKVALDAVASIERVLRLTGSVDTAVSLNDAMDAALAAIDAKATPAISTGFRCMDMRLGGLEPGLVYVIAGRPGMGKSSFGHQIAVNVARSGAGVIELSLEMSARQMGLRALSTASGVPIGAIKRRQLTPEQAGLLAIARRELHGLALTIDDAGGQTPRMIAAKVRLAKRKHGLGLVMIDHLNLTVPDDGDAKHGPTHAIEKASGMMLQIAKECGVAVLLLAQLNRSVEGRDDKRPGLGDLRQSGAIEQDAYAVGFVYREEYYLRHTPEQTDRESGDQYATRLGAHRVRQDRAAGKAELIWAKVRDGEPGTDRLHFDGKTATFSEDEFRGA